MAGKVVFDPAAKTGSVEVKITAASVSTGDDKRADGKPSRDEHLRSADFFNAAEFPEIVYRSTKLNFKGDTNRVSSDPSARARRMALATSSSLWSSPCQSRRRPASTAGSSAGPARISLNAISSPSSVATDPSSE